MRSEEEIKQRLLKIEQEVNEVIEGKRQMSETEMLINGTIVGTLVWMLESPTLSSSSPPPSTNIKKKKNKKMVGKE